MDLTRVLETQDTFNHLTQLEQFADQLLQQDEWRKGFIVYENTIGSLYEACKPEIFGERARPLVAVFQYLRGVIDAVIDRQDVDNAMLRIAVLFAGLERYFDFYNHERFHQALGYRTPAQLYLATAATSLAELNGQRSLSQFA